MTNKKTVTFDEAVQMFSGFTPLLNAVLRKFRIKPNSDGLLDRGQLEKAKLDQRYPAVEIDFVQDRLKIKSTLLYTEGLFLGRGEAIRFIHRHIGTSIHLNVAKVIEETPTTDYNGKQLYFEGSLLRIIYKYFEPVEPPSPGTKNIKKRGRKTTSV